MKTKEVIVRPFLRRDDNPCELVEVQCVFCLLWMMDSRENVNAAGFTTQKGYPVCRQCEEYGKTVVLDEFGCVQ